MKPLRRFWNRLRGTVLGRRMDDEFAAEIESHLRMQTEDNIRAGMSAADARLTAALKFGAIQSAKEQYRDQRSLPLFDSVRQDLRYACRTLWRSRVFTATALGVLALGIGANTTIYTVVRGMALRPLPFEDPQRLMFIGELSPTGHREAVAPANFADLARQSRAFERMAMYRGARPILTGRPIPESVVGANVSSTFFSLLGVQPQRGRAFQPQDEQPGSTRAAILSHASWVRLFSEDPAIVGRTIVLDGIDHTVVGVLPVGFSLFDTDVWVAGFDRAVLNSRVARNAGAIGRLAERVSLDQARAELEAIGGQLALAHPDTNAGWGFRTEPLQDAWLGVYRPTSLILLATVAMVLLIACGNLANLLLARALARDREVSIRLAIGAHRGRIVRQMLTESILLGVVGGLAGVLVAYWSLGLVVPWIPANTLTQVPGGANAIRLDLHTLGIVLLMSVATGVIFGLVPAMRMARADVQGALRETARGAAAGRQGHLWRTLVVAQVALSAILLIGATLMMHSFWQLQELDRGYDADSALSLSVLLPETRYPEPSQREAFFTTVVERLQALPGVTRVGGMTLLSARGRPFAVEGRPPASRDAAPMAVYRVATPDYLTAIGIPLVRGRHFSPTDGPDASAVAIVNQTLAHTAWPNEDPLGRRLQLLGPSENIWLMVVGVAGDVKESLDPRYPLRLDPRPTIYRPASQEAVNGMTLILRTQPDPLTLAAAVRHEIAAVDPTIPTLALGSVRQGLNEAIATPLFNTMLFVGSAALAVLLAAVGVYGVIAYSVSQRTQEIGIRMAMGAAPGHVLRTILLEGLTMALIGVALGVVGAFGAVRLIASYLYGVRPTDPLAFALVACLLLIVAAVASYVPARRAAGVDPLIALRYE